MKRVATALALLLVAATQAHAGVVPPVTVTPEPATLALLGTGIAAIGAGAWWRSRSGKQ